MKTHKCTRCHKPVTDDELTLVKASLTVELREIFAKAAEEWGMTVEEAAAKTLDPLMDTVPVCMACFTEVNAKTALHEFLDQTVVEVDPTFVWKEMKVSVLDD